MDLAFLLLAALIRSISRKIDKQKKKELKLKKQKQEEIVNSSRGFRGTESTVFPEPPEKLKRKEASDAFEKSKKVVITDDTSKTMESLREVKIDVPKNQKKRDQPQECILYDDSMEENNEQSVHKIQGQQKKEPKKTRQQDNSFEEGQFYGKQQKGKKRGKRPTALPGMILEDQQNLEENKL